MNRSWRLRLGWADIAERQVEFVQQILNFRVAQEHGQDVGAENQDVSQQAGIRDDRVDGDC
jgi:hypothetical protein